MLTWLLDFMHNHSATMRSGIDPASLTRWVMLTIPSDSAADEVEIRRLVRALAPQPFRLVVAREGAIGVITSSAWSVEKCPGARHAGREQGMTRPAGEGLAMIEHVADLAARIAAAPLGAPVAPSAGDLAASLSAVAGEPIEVRDVRIEGGVLHCAATMSRDLAAGLGLIPVSGREVIDDDEPFPWDEPEGGAS